MSEVLKLLWTPSAELRAAQERMRSLSSSPHKLDPPPSPAELPPPPAPEGTWRTEREGEGERGKRRGEGRGKGKTIDRGRSDLEGRRLRESCDGKGGRGKR